MTERWRIELKKIDRLNPADDLVDRVADRPLPPLPGPRPSTRVAISVFALLIAVAGSFGAFALLRGGGSNAPAAGGSVSPLWPEQTLAAAQATQSKVDGGDQTLAWRTDPASVALRFSKEVLGSDLAVAGTPVDQGDTVSVSLAPQEGVGEMTLMLKQLAASGEGGIWSVTRVSDAALDLPLDPGAAVSSGVEIGVPTSLPDGTLVYAGTFSPNCGPTTSSALVARPGVNVEPVTVSGGSLSIRVEIPACGAATAAGIDRVDGHIWAMTLVGPTTVGQGGFDPLLATGERVGPQPLVTDLAAVPVTIVLPRTNPTATATGIVPSLGGCTAAGITTGTELHLTAGTTAARGMVFIPACLTVAAGEDFTIVFENKDAGVPHNVSISPPCAKWADAAATICAVQPDPVFVGQIVTGPATIVYQVGALPAGMYTFRDDGNPNMHGTLVVR